MSENVEIDAMTSDELLAWWDRFTTEREVRLSACDLMNLQVAVARAANRPRKGDADRVWSDLLRKLGRMSAEVTA